MNAKLFVNLVFLFLDAVSTRLLTVRIGISRIFGIIAGCGILLMPKNWNASHTQKVLR
ncbi:hypothetical protein [Chryseobacterium sp. SC28]|uniref:hypothetical protein n=1 Tax=Chryseobacterium sp. SC28 TaxID=2268028 RepID=UPI0016258903|nr:hypothetical protein [Chryseobacterium sp. SC28]